MRSHSAWSTACGKINITNITSAVLFAVHCDLPCSGGVPPGVPICKVRGDTSAESVPQTKQTGSIPYFRLEMLENDNLWGDTYLRGKYMGEPLPPPPPPSPLPPPQPRTAWNHTRSSPTEIVCEKQNLELK